MKHLNSVVSGEEVINVVAKERKDENDLAHLSKILLLVSIEKRGKLENVVKGYSVVVSTLCKKWFQQDFR